MTDRRMATLVTIDGDLHATASTLHRAIILANQIGEIIRVCQVAKTGSVNSNLLDHEEVETILSAVNNLPYRNTIEAIEFSRPSVMTNGTMLLYILAFPKATAESCRLMLYATISEGKQVMLKYNKLAVNPDETYAVLGDCLSIGNMTVYQENDLLRLKENECIPLRHDQEVVCSSTTERFSYLTLTDR